MSLQRERQLGITAYVNDQSGFHASVKTIFRDFIVHEVDQTGRVLSLNSEREATAAARLQEADEVTPSTRPALENLRHSLTSSFDPEDVVRILEFVRQCWEDHSSPAPTCLTLSACADKTVRRARHAALRTLAPHFASTTDDAQHIQLYRTKEDGTALAGTVPKRATAPDSATRSAKIRRALNTRERCTRQGGGYLRFLLCKQNLDTTEVILRLARALGIKPAAFSHAGTKDRRGITTQEMRVRNTTVARLQQAAERAFGSASADSGTPQIRLGGFQYTTEPLRLGQLQGNYFRIVLRYLRPSEQAQIEKAIADLETYGFINYFGLQRFGSGQTPTHDIGIALLQGNWRKALDLILTGSLVHTTDEKQSSRIKLMRPILETYQKERDAARALAQLDALPRIYQRGLHLERRLLQAECRYGTRDLQAIFHSLPRNLRTLYLHAVQSYVWNEMASERIRQFGSRQVHEGDLVVVSSSEDAQTDVSLVDEVPSWNSSHNTAQDIAHGPTNHHHHHHGEDEDEDEDALTIESADVGGTRRASPTVHEVNATDVALGRYTIFDVVIPVPGLNTGSISCPAAAQAYRRFVETHQIELIGERAPALCRQTAMRGTFRRLLIRPERLQHGFIRHQMPREPLTQTDLDECRGNDRDTEVTAVVDDESKPYLACEIRFQLAASSYATMLLRELTKSETDRLTQSLQAEEHLEDTDHRSVVTSCG